MADRDAALHRAEPGKFKPMEAPSSPAPTGGTILDTVEKIPDLVPPRVTGVSMAPPPSFGETFSAARAVGRADRTDFQTIMLRDGYSPILEALGLDGTQNPAVFGTTGNGERNPTLMSSDLLRRLGNRGFSRSAQHRDPADRRRRPNAGRRGCT